ncbi:MAG: type II/IV secretion system protein [Planctomyces sp.]|nr:type II/IV secretion system protein [Planctomyces sp.]
MPIPAHDSPHPELVRALQALDPDDEQYAVDVVDRLLVEARASGASDLHLQPTGQGQALLVAWRLNGVLQPLLTLPSGSAHIVARLKVLADLLTYKTDVPQEGRIRHGGPDVEMRLSTFPTIHGEKAVVRLFVASGQYRELGQLGLPDDIRPPLEDALGETSGVVLAAGPSGSGKTTTLYACLRWIQSSSPLMRAVATLEDPVEAHLPGVSQSQIKPAVGFNYAAGLKSLLRQDPDVIMVGEIRDFETAETVFQASLTGHLVLTSFHAGSSAEAISRLLDMGVEPYMLRSGLRAILTQRLARRLCECAHRPSGAESGGARAVGCAACRHTGYAGRLLLAELVVPGRANLREAILSRGDAVEIEQQLAEAGVLRLRERAASAVAQGLTSEDEVRRVLGQG